MKKYYLVISTDMGSLRIFESREFNSIEETIKLWKSLFQSFNFIINDLKVEVCSVIEINDIVEDDETHEMSLYCNGINYL